MVRQRIDDIISLESEATNQTLKQIKKECLAVNLTIYAGNLSSILLAPIVYKKLADNNKTFDIYEYDIFIYAADSYRKDPETIYVVTDLINASKEAINKVYKRSLGTVFDILNSISSSYYYDNQNIVFSVRVPVKFIDDYNRILNSEYSKVSSIYKDLTQKDDLAYAIFTNSSTIRDHWKKYENLIGLVKTDKHSESKPLKLVDSTRNFPMFNLEKETYYAKTTN